MLNLLGAKMPDDSQKLIISRSELVELLKAAFSIGQTRANESDFLLLIQGFLASKNVGVDTYERGSDKARRHG